MVNILIDKSQVEKLKEVSGKMALGAYPGCQKGEAALKPALSLGVMLKPWPK